MDDGAITAVPSPGRNGVLVHDFKAGFNLFCCVYGIGTLGMPSNFASAGPLCATVALLFMAVSNVYASVAVSRVLLVAPAWVKTYGDMGEWAMGGRPIGRYLVVVSQMGVCLLVPCAFLVLGGTILEVLFPGAFTPSTWIIFMALTIFPLCLVPTLEESAGAAFAGCLGTILSDAIALGVLMDGLKGHPTPPSPHVTLHRALTTFGNLALAYGAAIVIPALQRQHPEPQRMPCVITVTLSFISLLFLSLATAGYRTAGCQISGNLLFSIATMGKDALPALGFEANRGAVVLAYLFMQMHITIAFSILLHPAFYVLERQLLGMHRTQDHDEYHNVQSSATPPKPTPSLAIQLQQGRHGHEGLLVSDSSSSSQLQDVQLELGGQHSEPGRDRQRRESSAAQGAASSSEEEASELASEYRGTRTVVRFVAMRSVVVGAIVLLATVMRDHFMEFADLIGASAITMSCLVLPIVFYLHVFWHQLPRAERCAAIAMASLCTLVATYVVLTLGWELLNAVSTENTASNLSSSTSSSSAMLLEGDELMKRFPFCPAGVLQFEPFYHREA